MLSTCIIIPTLRERNNLLKLTPVVFQHVPQAALLIVDDDSRDGTRELIDNFQKQHQNLHLLERHDKRGYGYAIIAGLAWAHTRGFDKVVTMDADFSHDPKEIPAMLDKLYQHDVVIGSRYVPGGGIERWSIHRRLLSWFAQRYVRFILGTHFHDSTTGFVGYSKKAIVYLLAHGPKSEGYSFLLECKHILQRAGHTIAEHPIIYTGRREEQSKMSWKNIWESIWLPWRLRFDRLKR
ncbi:MAG: polyprenol monophosphomannose synthase [Patescibacteria group bacterium]